MVLSLGCAFVVGLAVTFVVLWATQRLVFIDRPNARSAHHVPIPTVGGLGIVAGFWAGWGCWGWVGGRFGEEFWGLLGATVLLSTTVIDDVVRPLRPAEKTGLLLLAIAAWLCCGLHLEGLTLPGLGRVGLGVWGWPITALWFVFLCNAANFMDGIDGLSGGQALCAGGCMGYLLWELGGPVGPIASILALASGGFLVFNFPPARIFMGDVGALFIGFVLAACGVLGAQAGLSLWVFSAMLAVYFFDVSYTLVRRFLHGENVFEAHRKHLYQRLDKLGWSHRKIDVVAACISLVMGLGAHLYLKGSTSAGYVFALGGGVLVFGAVWIETQDSEFA